LHRLAERHAIVIVVVIQQERRCDLVGVEHSGVLEILGWLLPRRASQTTLTDFRCGHVREAILILLLRAVVAQEIADTSTGKNRSEYRRARKQVASLKAAETETPEPNPVAIDEGQCRHILGARD